MKRFTITALSLAIMGSNLNARTWTSSDGSRTFEGQFKSYHEESGMVTVTKGYKKLSFPLTKLSLEDRQWIRLESQKETTAEDSASVKEQLAEQTIGKNLKPGILEKLDGNRFVRAELDKAPEYYLLYFSASW
ncbi:hypothetical protein [Rubritalea marina]|uniref:hypothetical protein n=1 Tax=Rubritalea marina TaxID=361055 RepID=UPI0012EB04C7|nr:hypothetical protein [Rubritalea marina]